MGTIPLSSDDSRRLVRRDESIWIDHDLLEKWVEQKHEDDNCSTNRGLTPKTGVSALQQRCRYVQYLVLTARSRARAPHGPLLALSNSCKSCKGREYRLYQSHLD